MVVARMALRASGAGPMTMASQRCTNQTGGHQNACAGWLPINGTQPTVAMNSTAWTKSNTRRKVCAGKRFSSTPWIATRVKKTNMQPPAMAAKFAKTKIATCGFSCHCPLSRYVKSSEGAAAMVRTKAPKTVRTAPNFAAKFGAVLTVFGAFVLTLGAAPSLLFTYLLSGHWQKNPHVAIHVFANFAAMAGGCIFVIFTLVAIQGVLLNLFPAHTFGRVSLFVQAVLFIATVGCVPLMGSQPAHAFWWPPVWFVHLWEAIVIGPAPLARNAILAMTIPPVVSILAYLLSYHRYRRMLLEAQPPRGSARRAGLGSRLLERWISDPREQAAFSFMWKTLFRSRSHRLFLLAYAGAALGWIAKGLLDAPPINLRDEGLYGFTVVVAPIAVAVLITLGLRYLFTLPVMLRANWIFQAVEAEDRAAWHAAIERFVLWVGIAPVIAAGLPTSITVLGPIRGLAASALGAGAALLFFERYFREWRKLPFTCSYLPGRQTIWMLIARFFVGSGFLVPVVQLFLWASADATSFIALSTALAALWLRWRAMRRRQWHASTVLWDEQPVAAVETIDLGRAWQDDARLVVSSVRGREREFGSSLTVSRPLLPESRSEEHTSELQSRFGISYA